MFVYLLGDVSVVSNADDEDLLDGDGNDCGDGGDEAVVEER